MFKDAEICEGRHGRFATAEGIAFEAKPSADGTWHGYPIPWENVPPKLKEKWLAGKLVSKRQIRDYLSFNRNDIIWALKTDKN